LQAVNVMNDPSLVAHVDIEAIKKAARDLVTELSELSKKKVALLRLTVNGEQPLGEVSSRAVLEKVIGVMGPTYRASIKRIATGSQNEEGGGMDLEYIRGRVKILGGDLSKSISQSLGIASLP